ncbi:MAG: YbbR-like domain-containing protein [Leptospiraceae bacterium]|nr:YbbR-like domain-containing protein [Leptospiraceae bacterium]MCK6380091.1 YbbR-like domain-containing protein [Leptospiraceae bacterium]
MRLLDHWQVKLGSLVLSVLFYINLQNSKILVRTINIPLEYPKLSENLVYSKNNEKAIPVRVEGVRDLVNYHSQFMKAILEVTDPVSGKNIALIKKISNVPNGIKVTKSSDNIIVFLESKISKSVPFDVHFEDEPKENYIKVSHTIKPSRITVNGLQSSLEKLNKISLPVISLKEKKESFTKTFKVPDQGKNVLVDTSVKEVQVRVNITAVSSGVGEQIVSGIPVKCTGLDDSLEAELSDEEISIKFYSPVPLKSLDVIRGITASIPCNYTYDKALKKIVPNSTPVISKVRILKSSQIRNIEVLSVMPERIKITYKVKSNHDESSENTEDETKPEPPESEE